MYSLPTMTKTSIFPASSKRKQAVHHTPQESN